MFGVALGDDWSDPADAQLLSVRLGVIAAVGDERLGSSAGPPALAAHGWDRLDKRPQLGHVVAVGAGKEAAAQYLSIVDPPAARMAVAPCPLWEERLDQFLEFVVEEGCCHRRTPFVQGRAAEDWPHFWK